MEEDTVSVLEAAKLLGVGKDTVHRLIKAKRIAAHRKTHAPQSPFMIDSASVAAYNEHRHALAL